MAEANAAKAKLAQVRIPNQEAKKACAAESPRVSAAQSGRELSLRRNQADKN